MEPWIYYQAASGEGTVNFCETSKGLSHDSSAADIPDIWDNECLIPEAFG